MEYLTAEQVLYIHARLIEEIGGEHGLRDASLLISAVERPKTTSGGEEMYADTFSKAAALLDYLIRNHPFLDGNKRTAIASPSLFLLRNGFDLTATQEELTQFALDCARSRLSMEQIASWFQAHSHSAPNS